MRNSPCTHTEIFTFEEFSFEHLERWHLVTVTHNKALVTLYMDGEFVQSFKPINYPGMGVSKSYQLQGVVGSPTLQKSGVELGGDSAAARFARMAERTFGPSGPSNCVLACAPRTLNAVGQPRVSLSLR